MLWNQCLFVFFYFSFFYVFFFYVLVWIHCNVIYSLLSVVIRYLWIYCCNFRQKLNISKTCLPHVDFFHYLMCAYFWNEHCCSLFCASLQSWTLGVMDSSTSRSCTELTDINITRFPHLSIFFDQCLVKCFETKEIEVIHFSIPRTLHNEI